MPRHNKKFRCVEPGVTGLCNSGASCFINVIIQVLSQTYLLYNYFVNNVSFDGENSDIQLGPLSQELRRVFCKLWNGQYICFPPSKLYKTIEQFLPQYSQYSQSDCHEFLISFNTILHNELKQPVNNDFANDIIVHDGFYSIIRHVFYGQHSIEIKCGLCSFRRNTIEPFDNLSLAIPNHRVTLNEILNLHYASQTLEDYRCPQCQAVNCCTTTTKISKVPKVLVLCLKRFTVSFIDGEYCQMKNINKVDYPLSDLQFGDALYQLYAVVVHKADYGDDLESGHYIAYCKNLYDENWWKYNDDYVREASKHEVYQPKKSYLLFYELATKEQKYKWAHCQEKS